MAIDATIVPLPGSSTVQETRLTSCSIIAYLDDKMKPIPGFRSCAIEGTLSEERNFPQRDQRLSKICSQPLEWFGCP